MAQLTPLGNLPYPQSTDAANVPLHIQSLAESIDGRTVLRFLDAATRDARVTAPVAGMLVWLNTPGRFFLYSGTQWQPVVPGAVHKANTTTGTLAAVTSYTETLTGSTGDPTAVTFTVPLSGSVLVSVGARISGSAAAASFMSANIRTGTAVTLAAADARAAIVTGTNQCSASTQFQVNGLTAGAVCTATAAYKSATSNTSTFTNRFVTVTPLM